MNNRKSLMLLIPFFSFCLMIQFMPIPDEIEWTLVAFLCSIALIERLYMHIFNKIWLPYFIIVLGLIIFDTHSTFYGLFYIFTDTLYIWVKRKPNLFFDLLPSASISMTCILLGNEFYNMTDKSYIDRLITLLLLLIFNWILAYLFSYLQSGKMTTAPLINHFVPTWFEILVIFPFLASFTYFNYPIVLTTFFAYLIIVKLCHLRLLSVGEEQIQTLMAEMNQKDGLEILFMDLGEIKGVSFPKKKMIAVDQKLDYPEQLQTLIHEWLHFKIRGKISVYRPIEELLITLGEAIWSWYYIIRLKKI